MNCRQVCQARARSNDEKYGSDGRQDKNEYIKISPKCAAVLLGGTGMFGTAAAFATPTALCGVGFCPVGVARGTFASWWQSSMPLVAKGSVFAKLQSIAMGGSSSMAALQSVTGLGVGVGAAGAAYLENICTSIDEADPESAFGKFIDAIYYAVTAAIRATQKASDACASSETCTAGKERAQGMFDVASESASSLYTTASDMKKKVENQCATSETCAAGKKVIESAADAASAAAWSLWSAAKEGATATATRIGEIRRDSDIK